MINTAQALQFRRFTAVRLAAAICAAACLAGPPTWAGEAGASFRITIQLLPESAGSCTASSELGVPHLTCRPTVAGVASGSGGDARRDAGVAWLHAETPFRLAGEMIELGAENHYAWLENNSIAFSETSSRRVVAGGREYVETTFSW